MSLVLIHIATTPALNSSTTKQFTILNRKKLHGASGHGGLLEVEVFHKSKPNRIITIGSDGVAKLIEINKKGKIYKIDKFRVTRNSLKAIELNPKNNRLFTLLDEGANGQIDIWEIGKNNTLQHRTKISDLGTINGRYDFAGFEFLPAENKLVYGIETEAGFLQFFSTLFGFSTRNKLRLLNLSEPTDIQDLEAFNEPVLPIEMNHKHNLLAAGSGGNQVKIWDLKTLKTTESFDFKRSGDRYSSINDITFSPSGKLMAVSKSNGKIYVIAPKSGGFCDEFSLGDYQLLPTIEFINKREIIAATQGRGVYVINFASGDTKEIMSLEQKIMDLKIVDRNLVALGTNGGEIVLLSR